MLNTPAPLWTPDESHRQNARITAFQRHVERTRDVRFDSYEELWQWSVDELRKFWASVWDFFGLDRVTSYDSVLVDDRMPGAQWFEGSQLNFAHFVLSQSNPDATAIIATTEDGTSSSWTRAELADQVGALAATLTEQGVRQGDVVVGYLPNIGEAVIACLAATSLGAIWSSVGQDYSGEAVVDRFAQLEPVVLITADGYQFNGKQYDRSQHIAAIRSGLSTLRTTIVVSRLGAEIPGVLDWSAAVADPAPIPEVWAPFDHPLWVLYSSGTTGLPKGLVHGHGGILVETLKQLALQWDLGASDRLFWYTSPSWMMWNLQLAALGTGASIVCYDGSPTYPSPDAMWQLVADHDVTFFGTSPGYLLASQASEIVPRESHDLGALRAMGSTGSPLSPYSHRWAYEAVGPIPLWSVSGGTDVCSGFVGGAPTVPIWPGELSARCLGVDVDAWDEAGNSLVEEVGELVVRQPMPSMPVFLWGDKDGSRYEDAYFSTYPGVWRQGDWITITERGSVVIHGRSDSTLNRNGVRMGSADIYAAVDTMPEVTESLVIGAEQEQGGYWMPLFVVLQPGAELDEDLVSRIKSRIRDRASVRHVPDDVIVVPGIPHTRTGKKLEVPVKRILQGAAVEKVANPDAVDDVKLLRVFADIARAKGAGTSVHHLS